MNILVTGCSRGVGLEICRVLLEKEYVVFGIARTYTPEFELLEKTYPNRLYFKRIDLCESESVHDIITNMNLERLKDMYASNVFTPMVLTKYAIRNMLLHRIKGSIIHISSISAHTGYKGLAMYASSKGSLEAFSKNTAREWGELGIRSNVVVPGFMETAMSASLSDEQKDRIYKRTSLKCPTDIHSVAETVAFLLSENAISITGQNIHVDSGTI